MINQAEYSNLTRCFPVLKELDATQQRMLREHGIAVELAAESAVFTVGSPCESFLFLTSGSMRVVAEAETGREILLYRVRPGETCVFTLSCVLGHTPYPARGMVQEGGHAVALLGAQFERLVEAVPALRRMVFGSLSGRLNDLMALVEEVAFRKLDRRIASLLELRFEESHGEALRITHQEIADELGSAREIVSRILSDLEDSGAIGLGRRHIELRDPQRLQATSQPG